MFPYLQLGHVQYHAQEGQSTTEYMLLIGVIVLTIIVASHAFVKPFRSGVGELSMKFKELISSGNLGRVDKAKTVMFSSFPNKVDTRIKDEASPKAKVKSTDPELTHLLEHEIHGVAGKVSGEYKEEEEKEEKELADQKRKKIIEASIPKNYPMTRYVWAGEDLEKGVDCSGFVRQVYKKVELEYLDLSSEQIRHSEYFERIDRSQVGDGDIVVWVDENGKGYHVGVWVEHPEEYGAGYRNKPIPSENLHIISAATNIERSTLPLGDPNFESTVVWGREDFFNGTKEYYTWREKR